MSLQAMNSSLYETNETFSRNMLNAHWLGYTVAGCIGLVGLLNNFLILLITYRSKSLRTKCQLNLCSLACADMFTCAFFVVYGLQRFVLHITDNTEILQKWKCQMGFSVLAFAFFTSTQINVVLSLDRLLAITVPLHYRNWSTGYVILINSIAWSVGLVEVLWTYPLVDRNAFIPACTYNLANIELIKQFQLFTATLYVVVVIGLQTALLILLKTKLNRARKAKQNITRLKKLLEAKAVKAVGCILIVCFACMGGTIVLANIGLRSDDMFEGERWYAWSNVFNALNASVNIFVYLAVQQEFRRGFMRLLNRKTSTPLTSHVSGEFSTHLMSKVDNHETAL